MKIRTIRAITESDAIFKARTSYCLWDVPLVIHGKPPHRSHIPATDVEHMRELLAEHRAGRTDRPNHYNLANLGGTNDWVLAWP